MSPSKKPRRSHRVFISDAPAKTLSLQTREQRRGVLNYIFDGGMRIEFRTNREAMIARGRRLRVWRALAALAFLWLLFQFITP